MPSGGVRTVLQFFGTPAIALTVAVLLAMWLLGLRRGMSGTQQEMKDAVAAGYWPLYRYDPRKKDAPFTLDSKAPTMAYEDFLKGETRFLALTRTFPDHAKTLFAAGADPSALAASLQPPAP